LQDRVVGTTDNKKWRWISDTKNKHRRTGTG
jgi:hypothetical protein